MLRYHPIAFVQPAADARPLVNDIAQRDRPLGHAADADRRGVPLRPVFGGRHQVEYLLDRAVDSYHVDYARHPPLLIKYEIRHWD
jgi:hypothetical protein